MSKSYEQKELMVIASLNEIGAYMTPRSWQICYLVRQFRTPPRYLPFTHQNCPFPLQRYTVYDVDVLKGAALFCIITERNLCIFPSLEPVCAFIHGTARYAVGPCSQRLPTPQYLDCPNAKGLIDTLLQKHVRWLEVLALS